MTVPLGRLEPVLLRDVWAIYAQPRPGVMTDPIEGKDELVEALRAALGRAVTYAEARSVRPAAVLNVLSEMIRTLTPKQPTKAVLAAIAEIERFIDEAISGAAIGAPAPTGEDMKRLFDLSTLDFQRLAELFARGEKKTATEILRGQTEDRARAMANRNPTRIDLLERLSDLIDRYNAGSLDVERLFEELTAFTRALDEEEQRHLRENLSKEELAVFEILTRPEPKLSKAEELAVKKIARELLDKLKREKFILDWRLRETAKADVRETIRQEFDLLR